MLNALIGDMVGSVYEGGDLKGHGLPLLTVKSMYTDDTVLMVATADLLMKQKASGVSTRDIKPLDFARAYKDWGRRFPEVAYSPGFNQWLHSDSYAPVYSLGSGVTSRAIPIAWAISDEDEALELAAASALATHESAEAAQAASAVVHALFRILKGDSPDHVKRLIEERYFLPMNHDWAELHQEVGFSTHAEDVATRGIAIGLTATNLTDALRLCLYIGGDTDTIGALAGGIMEARQPGVVPPALRVKADAIVEKKVAPELMSVINEFNKQYVLPRQTG